MKDPIKLPEVLSRAIPLEDLYQLIAVIVNVINRTLIQLLLHTGIRIEELLRGRLVDTIQSEREIVSLMDGENPSTFLLLISLDFFF